jgi:hypothetical protein
MDGTIRMIAATTADSNAIMAWLDTDEKERIKASTNADGTVTLPTTDVKP